MKVKPVHWLRGNFTPNEEACAHCACTKNNNDCLDFECMSISHDDRKPRIAVNPEDHAKVAELRLTGLIGPYLD